MKKIISIFLIFLGLTTIGYCATAKKKTYVQKPVEVQTNDNRIIKGKFLYPKTGKTKYPVVVLLHSLGYSSTYWGDLPNKLLANGYAVFEIDFRGHGQSIYDSTFHKKYWRYFKPKAYLRFPTDITAMLNKLPKVSKKADMTHYAIIGADIGANTAILVAKSYPQKPKALVLISPSMNFKGLYTPIALTSLGKCPILTIASSKDNYSIAQQDELSKFAQGDYYIKRYPLGGTGMLLLKVNPQASSNISNWIKAVMR